MARLLAVVIAIVYTAVLALLALWMLTVLGLDLCSDPGFDSDDCIEGSSGERLIGLVLSFAAIAAALATVVFAIGAARGRRSAGRTLLAAVLTPLLAVAGLLFLPISF